MRVLETVLIELTSRKTLAAIAVPDTHPFISRVAVRVHFRSDDLQRSDLLPGLQRKRKVEGLTDGVRPQQILNRDILVPGKGESSRWESQRV